MQFLFRYAIFTELFYVENSLLSLLKVEPSGMQRMRPII